MRALISVYNKDGLDNLCKILDSAGCDIYSTGGTLDYIKNLEINVTSVEELTGQKEFLRGRVKTLHPKIHGAILADTKNPKHLSDLKIFNIIPFDFVINNLYPFEEILNNPNSSPEEIIENIDIGGPAMLRAAAKNFSNVTVLVDPKDYKQFSEKFIKKEIDSTYRKYLAKKVFKTTSDYDLKIFDYFNNNDIEQKIPDSIYIKQYKVKNLRYGENPHQSSGLFTSNNKGVANAKLLHGKEMSYLNYLDADAAFTASNAFPEKCVSIVKHTNTCGLSYQTNQLEAYNQALKGDPISAFGGIVGLNSKLELDTALEISKTFYDVIIAPSFSKPAFEILKKKKNVRLLSSDFFKEKYEFRTINGGLLFQEKDNDLDKPSNWSFVTKIKPSEDLIENLNFSYQSTKFIKSNAIVITEGNSILGIGSGQPNRINSVNLALNRARDYITSNSILASDAFFPFPDSIDIAAKNNIKTIIQPGGSIKDDEVIERADKYNISMIFTNRRHFSH
jgi:phosphoribosylaminoimidazolecarboxamide formyltransferase/IMP cyclohydrolase